MSNRFEPEPAHDNLVELAAQLGGSPLLERALSSVAGELMLSVDAREAMALLGQGGRVSVGAFLKSPALHDRLEWVVRRRVLYRAFKRWLERQGVNLVRASAPVAAPSAERPLRELLAETDLPDVADWPLAAIDTHQSGGESPLGELAQPNRALWLGEEVQAARRALLDLTRHLVQLRASARAAPPLQEGLVTTGHEGLDRVRRAAALARQQSAVLYPRGLVAAHLDFQRDGDHLLSTVRLRGARERVTVTFPEVARWTGAARPPCACGRPQCIHRALALDALLDQTGAPDNKLGAAIVSLLSPRWQRALDGYLAAIDAPPSKREQQGSLSFTLGEHSLAIRFHVHTKRGRSKTGRVVSRLSEVIRLVSGHDRRLAELLALAEVERYDRGGRSRFLGDAILALAGHPDVRWQEQGPLPVETSSARVAAEETEAGLRFRVFTGEEEFALRSSTCFPCTGGEVQPRLAGGRILLVQIPEAVLRFAQTLEVNGANFPREALPALARVLPRLEAVAAVELPEELRGEERPTQNRPVVRVESAGAGLALSLRIEPLPAGPLFTPGHGVPMAVALEGHKRTFARRDLERELAEAGAVAGSLGLDPAAAVEPHRWEIEAGERSVETLRRLSLAAASGLQVEWKMPRPSFTGEAKLDRLRLSVQKKRDWFSLEGEVEVDGRRITLAALMEAARLRRRWVRLGEDDYAQLSERLVEKLSPLAHLAEGDAPPTLTLGTVPLIDALASEVESLDAAEGFRRMTERMASARTLQTELPENLIATLRDYQADGFRWLSRLSQWGAGACLADDMGLGKTLQALALLLSRAGLGRALVVAPTSVLHIWRTEAERFAPSLRLRLFHEGDRTLGGGEPGEVLVVSWAMLAREAEVFAATRFSTVVLDEAHAIKNPATKRARAAHALQGDFVVALTGTPVENHLGDLWSLFRAVLPSLLGSEESFRRRFGSASPEAVRALAALAQPFILRRTKSKVAQELPPRTDIDLLVPLSAEERALYDDLRLAAAADLGEVTGDDHRFEVLAALTRLRLAACHPRLSQPEWDGPASKLGRLLELVRELSAAGHRALIFSQFTQHLGLVAEALRAEGFVFSYLDGQVPTGERQRRVEAFQAGGGGDLFLISLRAGGTGLTLTAADYVVHLDPWWNPAVEDQASDRAHRIGQDKPVTVYRLIAQGTIEQQILSLHREKRELIDAFLAGADMAGKLSTAQLAALIRGTDGAAP